MAAFNFTTPHVGCDRSCVVLPGEHPFVVHETVVAYRRGRVFTPKAYAAMQSLGCSNPWCDLSPELLLRIQQGALISPATRGKLKKMIEDALGRAQTPADS
jgi:hypothetical protein